MSHRKSTPRGQMTRGANSGPAIMLMPPHIRSTFMPNPPLQHVPPLTQRRKQAWTGVSQYLQNFEKTSTPPPRKVEPTPHSQRQERRKEKAKETQDKLAPALVSYRQEQKSLGGEFQGMNCYNTLFVARLAYEVTERKLLREMEAFGPVKDIKIIVGKDETGAKKSRGYAFVEYEHEEDMKRAYRAADGMRLEGREIVVDVERGHTVPSWLPRRLGGGLGGTRLGGKAVNVTRPGRFDPNRPDAPPPANSYGGPPAPMMGMGRGGGGPPPPPPGYGGGGGGGYGMGRGFRDGPRYGGPPPPDHRYGGPPMRGGDRKRPYPPPNDGGRYDRRRRY